ncbi:MAG: hypothetical protein EOP09_20270, partial [Proteobacteria bacterium]
PDANSTLFTSAVGRMKANGCFTCHGPGSSYIDLSSLTTERSWIDAQLIIAGAPDESFLIKKMRRSKSTVATMPPTGEFPASDYELLREWITKIVKIPDGPLSTAGEDVYTVDAQTTSLDNFLSQMKKLYYRPGSTDERLTVISVKWRPFWGGGCDFRRASISQLRDGWYPLYDDPTRTCDTSNDGPVGRYSVIKEGARLNACEFFLQDGNFLNAFFDKGIVPDRNFNFENAKKVFALYYPTLEFKTEIYDQFLAKAKAVYPAIEGNATLRWKVYLSTLCQSLYWEIP